MNDKPLWRLVLEEHCNTPSSKSALQECIKEIGNIEQFKKEKLKIINLIENIKCATTLESALESIDEFFYR